MTNTPETTLGQIASRTFYHQYVSLHKDDSDPFNEHYLQRNEIGIDAIAGETGTWEKVAEAVRAPLLKRIADLESRLEIDHVWRFDPNHEEDFIREDIPPEKRVNQVDGISARDSTISFLEGRILILETQLTNFERMEVRELKLPK